MENIRFPFSTVKGEVDKSNAVEDNVVEVIEIDGVEYRIQIIESKSDKDLESLLINDRNIRSRVSKYCAVTTHVEIETTENENGIVAIEREVTICSWGITEKIAISGLKKALGYTEET